MTMASGGRRNRSGPAVDPNSGRSDRRNVSFSALPSGGFDGDIPEFPSPNVSERHIEVWSDLWRTPQAAAWAVQSWRWSHVADLARLQVLSEDPDAPIAVFTHIRQARADLGLTPAGLIENGWAIAADDVGEKREKNSVEPKEAPKRRLRAVSNE
jgi:hypothetical protein